MSPRWTRAIGAGLISCAALGAAPALAQDDRSFFAEGSDAALGLGARQIAMGGTGAAHAISPYALHYNPALLALIDGPVVAFGRQADATLRPYAFAGVAVPVPGADTFGLRATLAAARYPRIHARSSGAFAESDPESVFLRFLLPGIAGTYDGDIDSKTMVNSFGLGVGPAGHGRWALGLTLNWIDCKTESCGVHANSDGVEVASAHATALSFGIGGMVRLGEAVTLAASVTDLGADLSVDVVRTDDGGTDRLTYSAEVPARANVEVAWAARPDLLFAAGVQSYFGSYGDAPVRITSAHFGAEWAFREGWMARAGALAPLEISTGGSEPLDIPVPFAPTLGVGWEGDHLSLDAAIYAHPIMTFHDARPAITAELGASYRF